MPSLPELLIGALIFLGIFGFLAVMLLPNKNTKKGTVYRSKHSRSNKVGVKKVIVPVMDYETSEMFLSDRLNDLLEK